MSFMSSTSLWSYDESMSYYQNKMSTFYKQSKTYILSWIDAFCLRFNGVYQWVVCFPSAGDSWCPNFELSLPPPHVSFTVNKHCLWHKLLIASHIATAAKLSSSLQALSLIYSDWRSVCLTSLSSGVYTNSFWMIVEHQHASGFMGSWLWMNLWSMIQTWWPSIFKSSGCSFKLNVIEDNWMKLLIELVGKLVGIDVCKI